MYTKTILLTLVMAMFFVVPGYASTEKPIANVRPLSSGIDVDQEPPLPPINDTCEDAISIGVGPFNITGETWDAMNDYDAGADGCTGFVSLGPDLVYTVDLAAGASFIVTMTADFDDSIYLVSDCDDVIASCVAGADAYPTGSTIDYQNETDEAQFLYLIVDSYAPYHIGQFRIEGILSSGPVATEESTWGSLKAWYR